MTTLEQLDKLIEYYEDDIQDFNDNIHEPRNEHQDYYEGRLEQLKVVLVDLKKIKSCS